MVDFCLMVVMRLLASIGFLLFNCSSEVVELADAVGVKVNIDKAILFEFTGSKKMLIQKVGMEILDLLK
jgi:hypothetical protein